MRICKIWDSEYPWDVRASKVARTLTAAGHEVHLVARNRKGRPVREELPECTVHRLRPLPIAGRMGRVGAHLNAASMFPAFFNPRWLRLIGGTAERIGAEMILCRDLPLAPSAIRVGQQLGIPVMLDMAENYPARIRSVWENGKQRWSDLLVRNPKAVELVERWSIRNLDHILVVVQESADRLIGMGVPPERITLVSNTPPRDHVASMPVESHRPHSGPIELVYLGLLEAPRGIATLISAVAICRERAVDVRLSLLGDGRERKEFEVLAARLGLPGDVVRFHGYVENRVALGLLRQSDAGVIPHHADEGWNTTIPNKLFDYMAAGIPVIGSDSPPVKRVIDEVGCGFVFRDRDPEDLARAITKLGDERAYRSSVEAGRRAIVEKYNWENDAGRLIGAVAAMQGLRRAA